MNALCESFALVSRTAGQALPAAPEATGLANVEMLANALDSLAAAQSGGWHGRGHHAAAVFMFGCLAHDESLGEPLCQACARCSGLKCAVAETRMAKRHAQVVDWDMRIMIDHSKDTRTGPFRMIGRRPQTQRRCLDSKALFGPERELVIRHDGAEYVLRITSQNKLILTK